MEHVLFAQNNTYHWGNQKQKQSISDYNPRIKHIAIF